jgi:lactoylglutathione lyase
MKLSHITITVKDLDESLKFYEEIVGLSIDKRFKSGPDSEIVFLGDSETKVELISNTANTNVNIGKDISLGFEVDSLDEMIEFVNLKGIEISGGIFQPNPHVRFFYVLDPNGVKVQFLQNSSEASS